MSPWQASLGTNLYTAAGSTAIFGGSDWCGSGCGTCYELTNTGTSPPGQGSGAGAGETITVLVTNECPAVGNEQWCSTPNQYGFGAHFDIMSQGGPNGWNNPIVTYRQVSCPSTLSQHYQGCECVTGQYS
ncbi:MAG: hypothetical protein M1824_002600 [Vezdaea acicularis]|nr:MAG: hypothetical protein M1824_002600 [Vezdaea acicularis]